MQCNIHTCGLIDPGKNLLQRSGGTFFLPAFSSQSADCCLFHIRQLTGSHITQGRLGRLRGFSRLRRINRRNYRVTAGAGCQLCRTECVPVVQADTIEFCGRHDLAGGRGIAVDDQEAIALIQCGVVIVLLTLVAAANYVADLQLAGNICDLAVSSAVNDAAPAIFYTDRLIIFCKVRGVGRGLAIGVDAGIKDETHQTVDSLGFVSADGDVDARHLVQPGQNLIQVCATHGGRIVIGGLNLGQQTLFGIAQCRFADIAQAANNSVDISKCSGGTQNHIVLKYQLLRGGGIKCILGVQRLGHIRNTTAQPSHKLFIGCEGQIRPNLLVDGQAAAVLHIQEELVVALINRSNIEAALTAAHHNHITGMQIADVSEVALLVGSKAHTTVVHQHIINLFCAFSRCFPQGIVVTECIENIGAGHILKAGLHNICKGLIAGAVGNDIDANLTVYFANEGAINLGPTTVLGIQGFQSGCGQGAQQYIACGRGIAGSGIILRQGGAICHIKCADGAIDICVGLAGAQADKHIIGERSLQTCSAGHSFHPLVGGQRSVVAVT